MIYQLAMFEDTGGYILPVFPLMNCHEIYPHYTTIVKLVYFPFLMVILKRLFWA